jgi:hypothetical protein
MRKNICLWLTGIALVIGFVMAGCGTYVGPKSPDFDMKAKGNGVVITKYKGRGGDVIIPAIINGRNVIGIGERG